MKLLFLGDFLYNYNQLNSDIESIAKYIQDNNYKVVLNLEAPLKSKNRLPKMVNLYNEPIVFEVLKKLNVIAVNLANNHIMDWSDEGVKSLINKLDKNEIGYFGAGISIDEAIKPYILKDCNKTIALYGFAWDAEEAIYSTKQSVGVAPLDYKLISKIIKNDLADIIVPTFHWGYEYEKYPQPLDRYWARKLIQLDKVNMIIGHHAHIIQAKEHRIYYGLGNFYFGNRREYFNNLKNLDLAHETKYGLGVVLDTDDSNIQEVYFKYDEGSTKVIENINSDIIKDISSVDNKEYRNFYKKNINVDDNKYFTQLPGFINEYLVNIIKVSLRNLWKLFLRRIKWPVGRLIKKIIKKV